MQELTSGARLLVLDSQAFYRTTLARTCTEMKATLRIERLGCREPANQAESRDDLFYLIKSMMDMMGKIESMILDEGREHIYSKY